jgi:transcriptional regulator with GAF, ATPase, and Fis domain
LEATLRHAHDQMESTVQERTAELTRTNVLLTTESDERKRTESLLQGALTEIRQLSDRLQAENIGLQQEVVREYDFAEIIGQSNAISYVFFRVEQVAPQDATVLLLGETGTGKGLVARAIHRRSARKDRPMITVNCTSLPANLIESELFGREKGAFTGAHARQMGRFELADGGTIFLDEIGEMPLELQCKLLRVIQDGEFERLGSPRTVKVDVRIIAASNRDLEEEIRAGRFREDLFYRLSVFPITIPPLRQRKDDIPLLISYFVAKYNKKIGKKIETVSKETLAAFQQYHWPGNVRELENVIERAVIISQGPVLQVLDRFDNFRKTEEAQDLKSLDDLERDHIVRVLQKTGWRIEGPKGAALLLGLNPSTLRARMRKYGIRR